ncbi:MAG TPA: twin-arginine translocation signal domain-containing protein, partial [Terriglobia bacterium]|nr:twin-arginine translocation signal domain-containing protein [Terriglobia bacterium]
MSTSRRTFLKTTVAGAGAALGGLPSLAKGSAGAVKSGELQPHVEAPSGEPQYTRGVGIYPGDPGEDFSPVLVVEGSTYRNLALHRPAYHSSSYDYNLTAQLVTDGIKDTRLPDWIATSASFRGPLPKLEREFFLDHNPTSVIELRGARPYVQVQIGGGESVPEVDRVDVLVVAPLGLKPENLMVRVSASEDGREWKEAGSVTDPKPVSVAGYPMGFAQRGQLFTPSIPLSRAFQTRFYRVEFETANAPPFSFGMEWKVGQVAFFHGDQRVEVGGPYRFTSAWMSAGLGEE